VDLKVAALEGNAVVTFQMQRAGKIGVRDKAWSNFELQVWTYTYQGAFQSCGAGIRFPLDRWT